MKMILSIAAIVAASMPMSVVLADRVDSKPIVEVVEQLEKDGYGPFSDISFDLGHWEIEVFKQDVPYELVVDGTTGKVLSEHRDDADSRPPKEALPLSRVLRTLIEAGATSIDDVSFERRYWEVELHRQDGKREVLVHPVTGEVVSDRLDD